MRILSAAHLPMDVPTRGESIIGEADDVRVVTPALDPSAVDVICRSLLDAHTHMRDVPVARVIRAIDDAAARLLDPDEPLRADVLASLHSISGFSPPMAAHLLDRAADDWRAPALDHLVRAEFGSTDAIERFVPRGDGTRTRAAAPPLALHVFAGNVPGVAVTSIVRSLIVRSAVLGKPAAGEPVLAAAFAHLLARADPVIGRCIAIAYWQGGDAVLEDVALGHAGLLVHYGAASAIADLRARAPAHVRVVDHGPRISIAVIHGVAAETEGVARDLARAVATFDQQGCVSPQTAWVIGSREQAHTLAAATAAGLEEIGSELPRGRIDAAEAAAIHSFRTRAEFAGIAGSDVELWSGEALGYTVVLDDETGFEGTCLNRTLLIRHVPDLAALIGIIEPFGDMLQTVGLAGFAGEDLAGAAAALGDAGATRITSLERMPWPPTTWHHDGRGPLQELVRWVDLEV